MTPQLTSLKSNEVENLPDLLGDNIDVIELRGAQRVEYAPEWEEATTGESLDYSIENGLLVSDALPHPGADYADRIFLPSTFQEKIIDQAHEAVGHMAANKTLRRITERYVWPGMRQQVRHFVKQCHSCLINQRTQARVPMGEMPLPCSPQEILGLDFIGAFSPPDLLGRKYVLVIVDHMTGWVEVIPTKTQSANEIIDVFTKEYLTRFSQPQMIFNDNGQGFGSTAWATYCEQAGIKLIKTTPVHPQGNGKVERANKTLKQILQKMLANRPQNWLDKLPLAVGAMRKAVSETTGFSPHYLTYGLPPQVPLSRYLPQGGDAFGNRLDDLAEAYRAARASTERAREMNRARLAKRATVDNSLNVGDTVLVKAEERLTNTARWDPGYIVTRVEGTTHWVRNPASGRERKVHREKLRLVDPSEEWDKIDKRPRRKRQKPKSVTVGGAITKVKINDSVVSGGNSSASDTEVLPERPSSLPAGDSLKPGAARVSARIATRPKVAYGEMCE